MANPKIKKTLRDKTENLARDFSKEFFAYEVQHPSGMPLIVAPLSRFWMDESDKKFAYRCLPLLMANTAGWLIKAPTKFSAWWKGGKGKEDLVVEFADKRNDDRVASHFGSGVLTFKLPYLFRTPKGINLWVKGPTNWPKDGIQALEGIVESDWTSATFTMNWIFTRPNHLISFDEGEPFCMIVPISRGLVEGLTPIQCSISANPPLEAEYRLWQQKRESFLEMLARQAPDAVRQGWEKDYFKGINPGGRKVSEHQTQIKLMDFQKK